MNVDVSPDGRTIAFDLLGDIYTMPIAGGTPTRISSGLAFDMQPRFSPDGRLIAFTSDRGGGDNIWVMNADGIGRARDHPRDLPPAERADLEPRRPVYRRAQAFHHPALARHRRDLALPCLAASARACPGRAAQSAIPEGAGRARLFARRPGHLSSAATPRPATPSNMPRIRTSRCSRSSATTSRPASAARSPAAPAARSGRRPRPTGAGSPTSTAPAAARGSSSRTCARARSARSMPISTRICRRPGRSTASIRTWPGRRTATRSSSGPAARSGGSTATAPAPPKSRSRSATPRVVIDPPRPLVEAAPADRHHPHAALRRGLAGRQPGRVRDARPALHPRRRRRRAPRLLTAQDGDFQLFPTWSRDGGRIAFVSWNDQRLGEIRTVAADGSSLRTVTQKPGHYRRPRFSPDGATIVYEAERRPGPDLEPLVGRRPASSASPRPAAPRPASSPRAATPISAPTSDRVFVEVSEQQKRKLISVDLNGGNRRDHAQGEMVTGYELSPDGRTLAFRENYNLFVTPFFGAPRAAGRRRARHPAAGHPGHHRRRHLSELGRQRGSPGAWARRSTAPTSRTCSATRPGGTAYSPPDRRHLAVDDRPRRRADRLGRPGRRADRHHGRTPRAASSTTASS